MHLIFCPYGNELRLIFSVALVSGRGRDFGDMPYSHSFHIWSFPTQTHYPVCLISKIGISYFLRIKNGMLFYRIAFVGAVKSLMPSLSAFLDEGSNYSNHSYGNVPLCLSVCLSAYPLFMFLSIHLKSQVTVHFL